MTFGGAHATQEFVTNDDLATRRARKQAFEDAAQRVERFRMPVRGDGPVLLLEVTSEIARQLRLMR